ncbi:MAG TPA: VOC family protein [Thermoleophilaceae bacterium]|nr:VOC family protein [Thermoleophilaceae bacterium]
MAESGSKTVIGKVGRVSVPVSDQGAAIAFYTEKLGFSLTSDIPVDENYRWVEVTPPAGGTPLAIVPPPPNAPDRIGIDTNVLLTTDDIDSAHAELRDRGVDVDAEVSRMGDPVPPMFWFRDQDGNTLLLVETPDAQ